MKMKLNVSLMHISMAACSLVTAPALILSLASFDDTQIIPTHGTVVLMLCLSIASVFTAVRLELLLAILACFDGLFEACALLMMPPEQAEKWLDKLLNGNPSIVSVMGPPCAVFGGAALGSSTLSQFALRLTAVAFSCSYTFLCPGAAAYVHSTAAGLRYAVSNACFCVIPGVSSTFVTAKFYKHQRAKAAVQTHVEPQQRESSSPVMRESGVPMPVHGLGVNVPMPVHDPGVIPVQPHDMPVVSPDGYDLNDSEGDMSASESHSSAGDSEYLAQWGPIAFGEVPAGEGYAEAFEDAAAV